jgi:hypothetical protein
MIFCARATRGRPSTQLGTLSLSKADSPRPGLMARLGVPVGGRVRKLRAVEDQSAPIPKNNERAWKERVRSSPLPFVLAEAARSECAPSTRAMKGSWVTPHQREMSELGGGRERGLLISCARARAASEGWEAQPSRPPARGTGTFLLCAFRERRRPSFCIPARVFSPHSLL